ncbi:MAG: hypothetical protein EAZ08_07155 [Cytophagales bacterium]|nr:MAG: hypothetical protein EAZ08_07155 [Cytophagales bacterium]
MKRRFIKTTFLTIALLLISCEKVIVVSIAEILQGSGGVWQAIVLKKNGTIVETPLIGAARYKFNADNRNASTYTAFGVTEKGILENGDKPNYNSTTNSGNWSMLSGDTFAFDADTKNPSEISFLRIPKLGSRTISIRWKVPKEIDKFTPTYDMTLSLIN